MVSHNIRPAATGKTTTIIPASPGWECYSDGWAKNRAVLAWHIETTYYGNWDPETYTLAISSGGVAYDFHHVSEVTE